MPTVYAVRSELPRVVQDVWTITGTNDGYPESAPQYANKTAQCIGTWAAGTVIIEESNDGTNWTTSITNAGTAASFTADGSLVIASNARYHRPRASVAVTSVVVTLTCSAV